MEIFTCLFVFVFLEQPASSLESPLDGHGWLTTSERKWLWGHNGGLWAAQSQLPLGYMYFRKVAPFLRLLSGTSICLQYLHLFAVPPSIAVPPSVIVPPCVCITSICLQYLRLFAVPSSVAVPLSVCSTPMCLQYLQLFVVPPSVSSTSIYCSTAICYSTSMCLQYLHLFAVPPSVCSTFICLQYHHGLAAWTTPKGCSRFLLLYQ